VGASMGEKTELIGLGVSVVMDGDPSVCFTI
jgi:hypothetical protein